VIRLDNLLEAAELPESECSETAVCELIGCVDPRTARRQLRRLALAIEEVSLDLTERRAASPELGEAPQISPGTPPAKRLEVLFDSEIRACERAGNTSARPSLRRLLQAALGTRGGREPSNRVSHARRPP